MRSVLFACSVLIPSLLASGSASALCRCACVQGVMRPICQPTDLVTPICSGLCTDDLRPVAVTRPLAGGRQVVEPVRPSGPAPAGLEDNREVDLNTDTRGYQLGTAGVQSGTSGFSSGSSGTAAGSAASSR